MVQGEVQKVFLKSFITLNMVVVSEIVLATLTLSVISANRTPPYSAQALMPNARKMDPRRGNSHAKIPKKWQFEPTNPHARDARKMTDLGELSCGHARKIVTIRTRSRNR